ncbi:MAG: diguanylate cyclase [Desulfocapsaceae bacterium]|nr:diguanylate cyclase [Desulfocapsaceae bacterium]
MQNILIVENNPVITRLLSHFFEMEGCEVHHAENGLQAVVMLDTFIPDIICTDIIMPKIGGDQLCQIIRSSQKYKDIFIVVYSSIALEDEKRLFQLDADLYIAKGPETGVRNHVRHILDQYQSGKRRENILHGVEGLYPRTITKELLMSRYHNSMIFENLAEAVIEMDKTGKIVRANRAAQDLLNNDLPTLMGGQLTDHLAGPDFPQIQQWFAEAASEESLHFQSSYERPLLVGKSQILLKLVKFTEKRESFNIAILQDITTLKETERQLTETVNEFNAVMESIGHGVLFMDSDLRARIANRAFREMWNFPNELFFKNSTFKDLIYFNRYRGMYDVTDEEFDSYAERRVMEVRKGGIGPEEFRRKDGIVYQYQCVVLPDDGRMVTYFDITRHKNTEMELAKALDTVSNLANRDALTGLPNLRLFQERFLSTLSMSKRKGWKIAIMFIDLDGFKNVNDSLGHEAGDRILKMVAQRLLKTVRKSDTVARIGGDEFLIIQTEVEGRSAAAYVANKIIQQLSIPFDLDRNEIKIGASIGIAMYPEDGDTSKDLLKKADKAMYKTKILGKQGYTFVKE